MLARPSTLAKAACTLAALALSAGLVWNGSFATFSAGTGNPTNNWSTGTVVLSDDDTGAAMFNATGLKPGSTGEKCISVSYTGTSSASIRLWQSGWTQTNSLGSYLDVVVEQGTGGSFAGGCAGFTVTAGAGNASSGTLQQFATNYTSYNNGFGTWFSNGAGPSAPETRTYRITYTVDAATPNSAQSSTAALAFTWEARDTSVNHLDAQSAHFEGSASQWSDWYGATSSVSSLQARSGSSSLRVNTDAEFWGVIINNWPGFAATPGSKTLSFWGRLGAGSNMGAELEVEWVDASANVLQTDVVAINTLTTTWQRANIDVVAPPGTASAHVSFTHNTGAAGSHLFLDDIFVGSQG